MLALPYPALLFVFNVCCVSSKFCLKNIVHMFLNSLLNWLV
jgi:hypothetical protein